MCIDRISTSCAVEVRTLTKDVTRHSFTSSLVNVMVDRQMLDLVTVVVKTNRCRNDV